MNSGTGQNRRGHRQRGAALVEMAIVISLFLALVFGILEFARAIFEWSRLVEATRAGARYAIVNDPACNIFGLSSTDPDDPPYRKRSCDPGPLVCDGGRQETSTTIAGNCNIDTLPAKDDAACRIVSEHLLEIEGEEREVEEFRGNMRAIQPMINTPGATVTITYTCTDAGFAGLAQRVPAVTVKVENVNYGFIVPGLLGLDPDTWSITMPPFATTRTGEDLDWIQYTGEKGDD